jgi:allantoinase
MKRLEEGDFLRAWGGIASLELRLPAVWTEARARGYAVARICEWLCEEPARFAGLEKQKGAIAVGRDANLVIWNPDAKYLVKAEHLHQRHKVTPYAGREMTGVVETTFLRGRKIYDRGEYSAAPIGHVLRRGDA